MTPKTLPDETARQRVRTELDRNFLVEAGAGTGKTRLLVDRIENLVKSGRARLRNVVAITFTEKATAELRVQIRLRIESALPTAAGEVRDRLRTAIADLEIAPISTIHAFTADLLRERPVEAGVDPAFTVADELAASLFRTEAWDRWLEKQKDAAPEGLREAIEYGVLLGQLRAAGDQLLRYRDVVNRNLDRGSMPADPLQWLEGAEPIIRKCVGCIGTDCLDHEDRAVADLGALGQTLDVLRRLAKPEARRTILAGLKLKIGGNQGNWKRGTLKVIKMQLQTLHDELENLRAAHSHWLAAGAVNWLRGYVAEYQALKAREGTLDFDDLLITARDLLRDNKDVRRYFQERFQAILVDEFQDTDPLQSEIIFFLAEDGPAADRWTDVRLRPGKLFIVGDPKQSIYAFRRADIETYELAKTVLSRSGAVEFITANFRSIEEVITAVNKTFEGRMTAPPDGAYQPDYVALQPSTETRSVGDLPALVLLYPDPDDELEDGAQVRRALEAETLAAFLRQNIDRGVWKVEKEDRPARFGDIALLFRGMSDVPIYEESFKRYDIPYRVTSSRTFHKREEVGWLLNVLHAVEHPTDSLAVWGALRSPLLGCSDREIYESVAAGGSLDYRMVRGTQTPESISAAYEILRELHANRNFWSVPRMVEEALVRTHALPTFLLTPQGEQRVANLLKVMTLARALEESGILTFRAFVHWLRDMEEQAVDEAESPTVEEGDNVVRIMSIHAAKGLEFPIVVIPDLGRIAGGGTDPLLLQRVRGTFAVYVGKAGQSWPVQTKSYEDLKRDSVRRDDAERLRVLYVAMTRAKDVLVLPIFSEMPEGSLIPDLAHILPRPVKFGERYNDWLMVDGRPIPRIDKELAPIRLTLPAHPVAESALVAEERSKWIADRQANVSTAGAPDPVVLPSKLVDQAKLGSLKQRGIRLETSPGGHALGKLVHEVLAVIPLDRADFVEEYVRYFARKRGVRESVATKAGALVRAALQSEFMQGIRGKRLWREVPFAMDGPDGIVEGAIDLVVADAGTLTVADFKTDAAGPELEAELRSVYAPQLGSYVGVLKRLGIGEVASRLLVLR